jgi:AraC-like DNA-binding protein
VPAHLTPFVSSWTGYREWSPLPLYRLELPTGRAVLVFELGAPIAVVDSVGEPRRYQGGFFAGIDDAASMTQFEGSQAGVQVNLTVRGAHAFVAAPMHEVARRVVAVGDLEVGRSLSERLAEARGWPERFALLTRFLARRFAASPRVSSVVTWALARIDESPGAVRIDELCRQLGYSRKHLHARFRQEVGLSPKRYADVRRFDHLMLRLRTGGRLRLADLAAASGYADQSHMAREVRRFSGVTALSLHASLQDPLALAVRTLQEV